MSSALAKDRSVVVLGLDGLSLRDLEILAERGLMPFTRHILARSFRNSPSVLVPYTAPSWTSVATGVNPGKHAIYDFVKPMPDGSLRMVRTWDVMHPRIHEILALHGLPSITSCVPFIYPPLPRRSYCVVLTGWTSPRPRTWPPGLEEEVKGVAGSGPPRAMTLDNYIEEVAENLEERLSLELELADRYPWKLFFTMIPHTDWVFHHAYDRVLKGRARGASRLFRTIDSFLRELVGLADGEPMIILVSDHGFSTVRRALNMNVALEKGGLLAVRPAGPSLKSLAFGLARGFFSAFPLLKHLVKYRAMVLAEGLGFKLGLAEQVASPVDYARSKAFMIAAYYIYVNPGLPGAARAEVARRVEALLAGLASKTPFEFHRGPDFFKGPYSGLAPDFVVLPAKGLTFSVRLLSKSILERGLWNVHDREGLASIYLPGEGGRPLPSLRELDVAPTALYYLGLKLPHDLDGQVLPVLVEAEGREPAYRDYSTTYRGLRRLARRLSRALT